MVDYSKSKIYKIYPICDHDEGDVYFGSTTQTLSKRMVVHRCHFNKGNFKQNSSCKLFEKYGLENCKIELIQNSPCNNKEELEKIEGDFIRNNKCINKIMLGRTKDEYMVEYHSKNRDKILEKKKQYHLDNRDKILEYQKKWRETQKIKS